MIVLSIFAILWCCAYGYTLTQPGFESKWIHLSYQKMYSGEIWRMFTASFFHIDVVHLLYDLIILFSLSTMENNKGSIFFIGLCFQILVITTTLQVTVYHILIKGLHRTTLTQNWTCSMGFSSVLIGLLTAQSFYANTIVFILFPGLPINSVNAPVLAYFLGSFLLTEASVLGHFCACFSGWLLGIGGLHWMNAYWLGCVTVWTLGFVVTSIKETTSFGQYIKFVDCESWPPWITEPLSAADARENVVDDHFFILRIATEREERRNEEGRTRNRGSIRPMRGVDEDSETKRGEIDNVDSGIESKFNRMERKSNNGLDLDIEAQFPD